MDISVVIPVYNEEKRLPPTLIRVAEYMSNTEFSWELLVVLDGCTDGSLEVLKTASENIPNLRWIDRKDNKGKGFSVAQGMLDAQGAIRLFTDADNSTDISHFEKMIPHFDAGCEVVISSRNKKDAPDAREVVRQAQYKRILGTCGNLIVQGLCVPGIWDTQCGFKAFTHNAADALFSRTKIDGWGFDIEALVLARKLNYPIGIIGANWKNDVASKVTLADYLSVLREAFIIRWNVMRGTYNL